MDPGTARRKLERASAFHWVHAVVVAMSLVLTFFAWHYSQSEHEARIKARFDREADQVLELVKERMQKYEEALWGGVALIQTFGGDVDFDQWRRYSQSIDLATRYPGINGIGVIHAVSESELPGYLADQRQLRADYRIHPAHEGDEYYPISYIIPVQGNEQAVGLDMAHETNRFTAAKLARDSGKAQITGPITLVQDSGKTPGFLFYAPFYEEAGATLDDRRDKFNGMVYAPFVVKRLLAGTLGKDKRHVGVRLLDGSNVLYDEHNPREADYDADPLFTRSATVSFYGRDWTFDIRSAKSFRDAASNSQPWTILVGGIAIDCLVIGLFIMISRRSQQALNYADSMTHQLEANAVELEASQHQLAERAEQLETSNAELEQFAYVASHDLQEPLRKISAYAQLLQEESEDRIDEEHRDYLRVVIDGAQRLKTLVTDLMRFSRITTRGEALKAINTAECLDCALENLELAIEESGANITADELPTCLADQSQLTLLFQNLVSNAIKYRAQRSPNIHISCRDLGSKSEFCVQDNGIGIDPQFYDRIFQIFQRLHNRREYSGTGIGLALSKRIVERCGGEIWLESVPGQGSKFFFTLTRVARQDNLKHDLARAHEPAIATAY